MAISHQERARGKGKRVKFTVTVRREGVSISATFEKRDLADKWARACQTDIERSAILGVPFDRMKWTLKGRKRTISEILGDAVDGAQRKAFELNPDLDPKPRADWTLARAFQHYMETVTPRKKGFKTESDRIKAWLRRPIAELRLRDVTPTHIQQHVNARMADGKAATTIRNEVYLLSAVFTHAAKLPPPAPREDRSEAWGIQGLSNPVRTVELPEPAPHRDRRLQDALEDGEAGEEERMLSALRDGQDGDLMARLFTFAVETGMRLGEILAIVPANLKLIEKTRCVVVPDSKNGKPRNVVLSTRAWESIRDLVASDKSDARPLFPLGLHAVQHRWRQARKVGQIVNLRFHDLRHEGLSRMANKGLNPGELRSQSGHRTADILLRYVNQRAPEVARKLG